MGTMAQDNCIGWIIFECVWAEAAYATSSVKKRRTFAQLCQEDVTPDIADSDLSLFPFE
jgi:hypothetical protein